MRLLHFLLETPHGKELFEAGRITAVIAVLLVECSRYRYWFCNAQRTFIWFLIQDFGFTNSRNFASSF